MRDQALLESALARPLNLISYESMSDVPRLAASYAFGIARNHPFADGNKRTALIAVAVFLSLNGFRLTADQVDAYNAIIALASGELDETAFADWIRERCRPR